MTADFKKRAAGDDTERPESVESTPAPDAPRSPPAPRQTPGDYDAAEVVRGLRAARANASTRPPVKSTTNHAEENRKPLGGKG